MPGRRFPIVANNMPRHFFGPVPRWELEPSEDSLRYFLLEAQNAGFDLVRLSLSPSRDLSTDERYYLAFAEALRQLNTTHTGQELRYLACDGRVGGAYAPQTVALLSQVYADPYLYGFSIDEPYERDFPRLSVWCDAFNGAEGSSWLRGKLLDINLFGIPSINGYERYVSDWLAAASPRTLSFDNYPVWNDSLAARFNDSIGSDWTNDFFYNLEIFREHSAETGLPFWNWILVHRHWSSYSHRYYRRATPADLRLQVYSSLAYGAKGLLYYNFWNPPQQFSPNGWHEESGLLDTTGRETDLYGVVRDLNERVLSLGDTLLQLRTCGVYHAAITRRKSGEKSEKLFASAATDSTGPYGIRLSDRDDGLDSADAAEKIVRHIDNAWGMVGILRNGTTGDYYLFVVNRDRVSDEHVVVTLDAGKIGGKSGAALREMPTQSLVRAFGRSQPVWKFSVLLEPGGGRLFWLSPTNGKR
ncbi:MAG TPA: hypothetical protein VMG34_14260 [Bacteroidota bacterium]|nr:hypothetical protein [Bacteroidota bacterium]